MTEVSERRADTRQRLIDAAAQQFARRPYDMVSLGDILAEAELTKGAMYFHFASKHALASALIDELTEMSRTAVAELVARGMSGLETLIDAFYLLVVQNAQQEVARAGARLLETLDSTTARPAAWWQSLIDFCTTRIREAIDEGDVLDQVNPESIAKMLLALSMGMRRISHFDQPERYLDNLETAWIVTLPVFVDPVRIDYFTRFINRRHAIVVKNISAEALSLASHRDTTPGGPLAAG